MIKWKYKDVEHSADNSTATLATEGKYLDADIMIETAPELAIVSQPVSVTVKNGATAYFTVGAIGKNVQYQWQFYSGGTWNNTGLPGDKTSKLTVDSTSRNGAVYRCVVSDETGFIESNSATLNTYKDPSLMETSATPTKSQQVLTPPSGIDGFSKLTVEPIPPQFIVPTGSKTITENGTHPVTEFAEVVVDVQGEEPIGDWDAGLSAAQEIGTQTGVIAQIAGALVGKGVAGGGGLEFETGTFIPETDTDIYNPINFENSHDKPPAVVICVDSWESANAVENSFRSAHFVRFDVAYVDGSAMIGTGSNMYLRGYRGYINASAGAAFSAMSATTETTANTLANDESFRFSTSTTGQYYRAGRTYKWIAIWI